jgi:hypothetical protein
MEWVDGCTTRVRNWAGWGLSAGKVGRGGRAGREARLASRSGR